MKYLVYIGSSNYELQDAIMEYQLPFVHNWMTKNGLTGFLLNLNDSLVHYLEGDTETLEDAFQFLNMHYGTTNAMRLLDGDLAVPLFSSWTIYTGKSLIPVSNNIQPATENEADAFLADLTAKATPALDLVKAIYDSNINTKVA